MVDSVANRAEGYLIVSFQFKIHPGASYVTDRRSCSFFTAGSNIYQAGSGTRVMRINVTGDGWLDPSTVRLHLKLTNNDSNQYHYLRTIGGPWSFFRRVRCLIGGALVDDIDYYNRVHELMSILSSENNRANEEVESFGPRWDSPDVYNNHGDASLTGIPSGSSANA